jgi:hypothetical protein
MRKLLLSLVGCGLLSQAAPAEAQRYGEWDVPCDLQLGPRFSRPYNHGVIYERKEFLTSWQSASSAFPLPSYNWYNATPNPDPVSTDGTAYWDNAGVKVHCWVERNPYVTVNHRHPVDYRGFVRSRSGECIGGSGGTGDDGSIGDNAAYGSTEYDPYDSGLPEDESCSGGTGGTGEEDSGSGIQFVPGDYTGGETIDWETGIGNGGTSVCGDLAQVEFICIDTWNAVTEEWETWSCGYATTC